MVNQQHIHKYLSSFIQYSQEDILNLEVMVEKETFSTLVNLALLKAYHQNNETEKYRILLPKLALMVPDRNVLKKHIDDIEVNKIVKTEFTPVENQKSDDILEEKDAKIVEDIVEPEIIIKEEIPEITVEKIHEFSPEKSTEIIEETIPEQQDISEELEEPETIVNEEIPINPVEKIHEFSPENSTEIIEETILEQEDISDEIKEPETIVNEEIPVIPVEKIHEFSPEKDSKIIEETIPEQEDISEELEEPETFVNEEESDDFFSWLQHINDEKTSPENIENIVIEKEVEVLEIEEENDEVIEEIEVEKPQKTQKEIDDLLNKFISTNPSISRPKMNFYNPMDKAKESEEIKEDVATETLAKIYVSQQLFDKAIMVWEILQKNKPEKAKDYQKEIDKIRKMKKGK